MEKIRVMSIFGTRPEGTKMAPLVKVLAAESRIESIICVTGQHRQQLDQVLEVFDIRPDFDLDIMIQNQDLAHITTAALNGLMDVIRKVKPDLILVHGDTTTTMAAGLAAFYSGVKLGHVEAGLRTFNKQQPFPEEINRKIVSVLADLNFAPTSLSKDNLLAEGVTAQSIFVTGNTSIDAIDSLVSKNYIFKDSLLNRIDWDTKRIIAVTAHRRENYGAPLENICKALLRLAADFADIEIVYPVHLSPSVRDIVFRVLGNNNKIHLLEPADPQDLLNAMARSYMVMTDSGGIQEEAPHLDKPVLVMREVTERPEGVEAGCLRLAGTDEAVIYDLGSRLLRDKDLYAAMANSPNPFGDGMAAKRILAAILFHFGLGVRPRDFENSKRT